MSLGFSTTKHWNLYSLMYDWVSAIFMNDIVRRWPSVEKMYYVFIFCSFPDVKAKVRHRRRLKMAYPKPDWQLRKKFSRKTLTTHRLLWPTPTALYSTDTPSRHGLKINFTQAFFGHFEKNSSRKKLKQIIRKLNILSTRINFFFSKKLISW